MDEIKPGGATDSRPAFARRAVLAGLGLAGFNLIAAPLGPFGVQPALAATELDKWIVDLQSTSSIARQISEHMIHRNSPQNYTCYCKTTLTLLASITGWWTTTKTFMCTRDDGQGAYQVAYIGPDYRSISGWGSSMSQNASFALTRGGTYRIVGDERDFRNGTSVAASWKFTLVIPFLIVATAGEGGKIAGSGNVYVNPKSSQKFTMTPDAGYAIKDVTVDGKSVGAKDSYTFTSVYDNHEITVTFEPAGEAHFMLVDGDGDVTEVYKTGELRSSTVSAGDRHFIAAEKAISDIYAADGFTVGPSSLDSWYPGSKDFDPSVFKGAKFTSQVVKGDIYIWCRAWTRYVYFVPDSTNIRDYVFRSPKIPIDNTYTFPLAATSAAIKPCCNLNANHGQENSTGFTGWHREMDLSDPAMDQITVTASASGNLILYGRNRLSLRFDYSDDTERRVGAAGDYRTAPMSDAPIYENAFALPDFTGSEENHEAWGPDGTEKVSLPPIGDDGEAHTAIYHGERASVPLGKPVYEKLPDGRWRCFVAEGWKPASASVRTVSARSDSSITAWTPMRDETRLVRWRERKVDGTEAFVPGYNPEAWM
ncbi:MAG: hypothetical protein SOU51_01175 [Collinsella sp.]|nr:hypothetical protein [Collinsella sp.]